MGYRRRGKDIKMNKNVAVILAGGQGERFNTNLPKQFAKIAGKSTIEHTIDIFEEHELIDEIRLKDEGEK